MTIYGTSIGNGRDFVAARAFACVGPEGAGFLKGTLYYGKL